MSYLLYMCLFAYSTVKQICVVFLFCLSSPCVPYLASFSGLSQYQTLKGQRINGSLCRSYHTNILLKLSIHWLDLELMHINKPVGLEYDVMY
jgi:hypothetical protein